MYDVTIVACGRLQNAIKYSTKVMRKTGSAGPVQWSNNSATVKPRLIKCCKDINSDLVDSHTGYDVTSYFRSAFIEIREKQPKMLPPMVWVEF